MTSNHRSRRVRRWSAGAGLAAAAMIGAVGAPAANADDGSVPTDIGLLNTAQTDIAEAFALSGHTEMGAGIFPELEAIQTPLLSSDNSLVSGFGEALFNGPDQNLAQSSEAFLSAAQTLSSDTGNLAALGTYASDGFQVTDAILGEIPSTLVGKLTDQIFDIGGFDTASASAATDVAASASSAAATPDDVIGQAISVLNQGDAALDAAPTADLSARAADILTDQEGIGTSLAAALPITESMQDQLSATDQTFVAGIDEQLVSASQNILSADQAFVAADHAGQLTGSGLNVAEFSLLGADVQSLGAVFDVIGADIVADLTGGLGTSSADLASSFDPAGALDPSVFADLLSSFGL